MRIPAPKQIAGLNSATNDFDVTDNLLWAIETDLTLVENFSGIW